MSDCVLQIVCRLFLRNIVIWSAYRVTQEVLASLVNDLRVLLHKISGGWDIVQQISSKLRHIPHNVHAT